MPRDADDGEVIEVRPTGMADTPMAEDEDGPWMMCSGFVGGWQPEPPAAPWWRVLVWFLGDELERLARELRFRWGRAARLVAEELESRRRGR